MCKDKRRLAFFFTKNGNKDLLTLTPYRISDPKTELHSFWNLYSEQRHAVLDGLSHILGYHKTHGLLVITIGIHVYVEMITTTVFYTL